MFLSRNRLKIITIKGIPIKIDWSWILVFILVTWSLASAYFPEEYPGISLGVTWLLSVFSALFLFSSILLHELSHSIVAQNTGLPINEITLFIFGGVAHMGDEPSSPSQEFKIAVAGPLMSLFLAVIFLVFYYVGGFLNLYGPLRGVFQYGAIINIAVIVFNMAPGLPLDGGRIFRAFIWKITNNLNKATYITAGVGFGIGLMLVLGGIFVALILKYQANGIWMALIGIFLIHASKAAKENVHISNLVNNIKVKEAMKKNIITVPEDINIFTLTGDYFMKYPYRGYPIISTDNDFFNEPICRDKVIGYINIEDIVSLKDKEWMDDSLTEVVKKGGIKKVGVDTSSTLKEALLIMRSNKTDTLMVFEKDFLVGIVTQKDVVDLIALRLALYKKNGRHFN